jgi:uncharacterized protein YbjT (DUF2867 family)
VAKTALIIGSTGLIGRQLLESLLLNAQYDKVIAIARAPIDIQNAKLVLVITELNQLESQKEKMVADDIFCCLGTTMKVAKSKEAFKAVDFDAPIALAKIAKQNGAKQFLLISALGANKNSSIFYNRIKGEVEEQLDNLQFQTTHILRPSLLTGNRNEERAGEKAAHYFYKLFGKLIPLKYKAIDSAKVATAMNTLANASFSGKSIHESDSLQGY